MDNGGKTMRNRAIVAGLAIVAVAILALAIAVVSADDDDDEDAAAAPSPTATATQLPPSAVPTSPPATQGPVQRPDQPVSATPGAPPPSPTPTELPLDRHPEPAPIDGLEMLILESFPPQYMLNVKAGLPSGCAQPLSHRIVGRQGNVIQVEVLNSLPDNAICTAIYGMYELNINLGSDFTSGQTYIVRVNNEELTFRAQ
jgi:hypothetical protein